MDESSSPTPHRPSGAPWLEGTTAVPDGADPLAAAYASPGPSLDLGTLLWAGENHPDLPIRIPLPVLNGHGLIGGAFGTGRTRTVQVMAERLSAHGIPVVLADSRGDLSGIAAPGPGGEAVERRAAETGEEWAPQAFPCRCYAPAGTGALRQALAEDAERRAGGTLADLLGGPRFDTAELLRTAPDHRGVVSVLDLTGLRGQPRLVSALLLWLLTDLGVTAAEAAVGAEPAERGSEGPPRLVLLCDGAQTVPDDASPAYLEALVGVLTRCRTLGIGVFLAARSPQDVPASVLEQLDSRVQHALLPRAVDGGPGPGAAEIDREVLAATVRAFPESGYDLAELLITGLGTGEAVVSAPGAPGGGPGPVAAVRIRAPQSMMGPLGTGDTGPGGRRRVRRTECTGRGR